MRQIHILTLLVFVFAAFGQEPQKALPLPNDEQGLFDYARARMNRRQWRDADRVFELCLQKFPEGKLAERIHFQLGTTHVYYSRRRATGREWLETLCKRWPKSDFFWQARRLIAESFARDKDKENALAEYQRIVLRAPNAHERTRAAQAILRLKDKYFRLHANQTFTEGESAHVQVGVRNVREVRFKLYRIAFAELVERLTSDSPSLPEAARRVPRDRWQPVREWTERFDVAWKRHTNREVSMPVQKRGFYVVEGAHEGVTMTVAFPVNRYGLILKAAAGRAVVFAQDRVTGAPVPGMRLRLVEKDAQREFTTDASGLAVAEGCKGRGFWVGVKDADHVFANVSTYGWTGKESRYYITTDRPIYRPNQRVFFNVVHRTEEGAKLEIQKDLRVLLKIFDAKNNEVHQGEYATSEFGSLSGSFLLGDEPALGIYRIHVEPLVSAAPVHDWGGRYGRFRVDEYRKPEFKVAVAFDKRQYVQGDTLKAVVRADYYFGSPVPNAKVRYRVLRNAYWPGSHYRHGWYRWYIDEDYGYSPRRRGKTVASGQGVTDEQGRLELTVAIPRWEQDASYSVVADVTDLSRRQVSGSGTVRADRAAFSLSITVDRYVYRPGEKMKATVKAVRPDGKPVPDQLVRVTALRRTWRGKEYEETEKHTVEARTDGEGKAHVPLAVAEAGYYVLKASAVDERGNETWTKRWVWVASREWGGGLVKWNGVDIVPDRSSYRPGETATFLISSEVKDQHVLVTFESTRIHRRRVVRLNGHTATVSVKLDDPTMVPNIYATATALHGSKLYRRQRSIMIDPSDRFLTVEIRPDKARYRPREPAAVEIVTRDVAGNPVSAEVSLAIVDESIYALQEEYALDIRRFFVRKRRNRITTVTSLHYWQAGLGGLEEKEDAGKARGAPAAEAAVKGGKRRRPAADDGAYAETEVRTRFADTMYWAPSVVTNEHGRATLRLDQVADNLTTWRITARAMTRDGRMGQSKDTVIVRKELIVRLHAPRFYTQGDRTLVSTVVHNYLDSAKQVKVLIAAEGLDLGGAAEQTVEIAAQGEARLDWPVTIGAPGKATITVKALTDEESDAMEVKVPLLPHGSLAWTSSTHLASGGLDTSVTLPQDAIPEATELIVVVSPTHAATVLDSLDWLADYPYGCVEQTMSRFLPSVITAQVLRKLNIAKPDLERELPAMIAQGLQRLYNFQQSDGGWGWWKNDSSSPFTTAYVVYGLAMAREADVAVSGGVLSRGINALLRMVTKAEDDEQRAYMLFALSAAGQEVPDVRNALADALNRLDAANKAMLALVLQRDGERREAKRVLRALAKEAQDHAASVFFKGAKHYRWTGHNVETTALALKAFLAVDPQHPLVPRIVTWLAMNRDGQYWVSTRQTAMVVYAMADYLARTQDLDPDLALTLSVNGQKLYERRVTRQNWREFNGVTRVDPKLLRPGRNRIELLSRGRGTPICSIFLKHFKRAETFSASKGGLQVERSYALVSDSSGKRLTVPLDDGAQVASGSEVQVTLKIKADRAYRYLMLEDPMPAGFEAVREQARRHYRWRWWYSHKEFRDEKVVVAVTYLPEGQREITYVMRAETPGEFKVLPTLVWNMYRKGEGANSRGRTIKVVDN